MAHAVSQTEGNQGFISATLTCQARGVRQRRSHHIHNYAQFHKHGERERERERRRGGREREREGREEGEEERERGAERERGRERERWMNPVLRPPWRAGGLGGPL